MRSDPRGHPGRLARPRVDGVLRALVAAVGWVCTAAAAHASGLSADVMGAYGGSYSAACADPALARLRVVADALVIEVRGKTITGRKVEAAASYFGNSPPPGYRLALLSELRGGQGMLFVVYADAAGQYIEIDGDPKLLAALDKSLGRQKYRDCDAQRNQRVAAAVAAQRGQEAAAAAAVAQDRSDPMNDRRLKAAYLNALGPRRAAMPWLARFEGPSPERKQLRIAGENYTRLAVCKPHDCFDNNAVVLFSFERGLVHGKVFENGARSTLIGAPPPLVAAELERLWRAEFRQGR